MKKITTFLSMAILAMGLFATSANAQETATISGIVTDAATGDPIEGATVYYYGTPSGTVTTDADGHYSIDVNLPGEYRIEAWAEGYEIWMYGTGWTNFETSTVINIALEVEAPATTIFVSGSFVDAETGEPLMMARGIVGEIVEVGNSEEPIYIANSWGNFETELKLATTYQCMITDEDGTYESYDTVFTTPELGTNMELVIKLTKAPVTTAKVWGEVTSGEEDLEDVKVMAMSTDGFAYEIAYTDMWGEYELIIKDLTKTYTITFSKEGYETYLYEDPANDWNSEITFTAGEERAITANLNPVGGGGEGEETILIMGAVVDVTTYDYLEGLEVYLYEAGVEGAEALDMVYTDAEGGFEIEAETWMFYYIEIVDPNGVYETYVSDDFETEESDKFLTLITLSKAQSTGLNGVLVNGVNVYGGEGCIYLNGAANASLDIYTLSGVWVRRVELQGNEMRINMPAGVYVLNGSKVVVR